MTDDNLDDTQPYKSTLQDHDKAVWNEAIEAAATIAREFGNIVASYEIRKLKK